MSETREVYLEIEEGETISFEIESYGTVQGEVTYVEDTPEHKDIDVNTDDGLWTLQFEYDSEHISGVLFEDMDSMEEKAGGSVVEINSS